MSYLLEIYFSDTSTAKVHVLDLEHAEKMARALSEDRNEMIRFVDIFECEQSLMSSFSKGVKRK